MKKVTRTCTSTFVSQAEEIVSLAFAIAEDRIRANKGKQTPEVKALTTAVLAVKNTVAVFIAVAELNE